MTQGQSDRFREWWRNTIEGKLGSMVCLTKNELADLVRDAIYYVTLPKKRK
jgi:hypothetical protein